MHYLHTRLNQFMAYITLNPTGIKRWMYFYLCLGIIVTLLIGILDWKAERLTFNLISMITAILGYLCVYHLGMRYNSGNILGMLANIGEIIVQSSVGNFGLALGTSYNFIMHVIGWFNWRQNTHQQTHKVMVKNADKLSFIGMFVFLIIALSFIYIQHQTEIQESMTTGKLLSWVFYANILVLLLSVLAQGTMIMRYKFAWWIWFVFNLIGLTLNLHAGNYIFAAQSVIYQLNIILAIYEHYINSTTKYDHKH